jgi:hypothetical protein
MAKGEPNYAARQVVAAGGAGVVGGGGVRAATDLNPESVTTMVPTSVMNPDTGSSVVSHVMKTVTDLAPAAGDIAQNMIETGALTGLAASGAVAVYHGIKHVMNQTQFGKHL